MTKSSPARIAAAIVDLDNLIKDCVLTQSYPSSDDSRITDIFDNLTTEEAESVRYVLLAKLAFAGTIITVPALVDYIIGTTLAEHAAIQPKDEPSDPADS